MNYYFTPEIVTGNYYIYIFTVLALFLSYVISYRCIHLGDTRLIFIFNRIKYFNEGITIDNEVNSTIYGNNYMYIYGINIQ